MGTVSWVRGEGPLAPFAVGFRQKLVSVGHTPATVKDHLGLMGQLDGWLCAERLDVVELTPLVAQRFLDTRRARGQQRVPTLASLAALFNYLSDQAVLAPKVSEAPTRRDILLARYRHHLVHDRGSDRHHGPAL